VTGLVLLGLTLVSVGIDATIRQWSLKPDDLRNAIEQATKPPADEQTANAGSMLTEEEERELAELLEDD
jgi:UDP-N-acetylglucosamine:LPS N-acetylglucosamine transferase